MGYPALVAALVTALIEFAETIAGRVLVSLGFAWLEYTGLDTGLTWFKGQALGYLGTGMNSEMLGMLGVLHVGSCINIVFSAIGVRMLLDGLQPGGKISKLVHK